MLIHNFPFLGLALLAATGVTAHDMGELEESYTPPPTCLLSTTLYVTVTEGQYDAMPTKSLPQGAAHVSKPHSVLWGPPGAGEGEYNGVHGGKGGNSEKSEGRMGPNGHNQGTASGSNGSNGVGTHAGFGSGSENAGGSQAGSKNPHGGGGSNDDSHHGVGSHAGGDSNGNGSSHTSHNDGMPHSNGGSQHGGGSHNGGGEASHSSLPHSGAPSSSTKSASPSGGTISGTGHASVSHGSGHPSQTHGTAHSNVSDSAPGKSSHLTGTSRSASSSASGAHGNPSYSSNHDTGSSRSATASNSVTSSGTNISRSANPSGTSLSKSTSASGTGRPLSSPSHGNSPSKSGTASNPSISAGTASSRPFRPSTGTASSRTYSVSGTNPASSRSSVSGSASSRVSSPSGTASRSVSSSPSGTRPFSSGTASRSFSSSRPSYYFSSMSSRPSNTFATSPSRSFYPSGTSSRSTPSASPSNTGPIPDTCSTGGGTCLSSCGNRQVQMGTCPTLGDSCCAPSNGCTDQGGSCVLDENTCTAAMGHGVTPSTCQPNLGTDYCCSFAPIIPVDTCTGMNGDCLSDCGDRSTIVASCPTSGDHTCDEAGGFCEGDAGQCLLFGTGTTDAVCPNENDFCCTSRDTPAPCSVMRTSGGSIPGQCVMPGDCSGTAYPGACDTRGVFTCCIEEEPVDTCTTIPGNICSTDDCSSFTGVDAPSGECPIGGQHCCTLSNRLFIKGSAPLEFITFNHEQPIVDRPITTLNPLEGNRFIVDPVSGYINSPDGFVTPEEIGLLNYNDHTTVGFLDPSYAEFNSPLLCIVSAANDLHCSADSKDQFVLCDDGFVYLGDGVGTCEPIDLAIV